MVSKSADDQSMVSRKLSPRQVMFVMIFLFSLGLRAALLPSVGVRLGITKI